MKRYAVTGFVNGFGKIQHVIKAIDRNAAKARFRQVYKKQGCSDLIADLMTGRRPQT